MIVENINRLVIIMTYIVFNYLIPKMEYLNGSKDITSL